jgi:hypothetical protein
MKLKEIEITALEVVENRALSVISSSGGIYMIKSTDTSDIEGGTLTEIVTDFTRNGDTLEWRGQVINLDQ